MVRGWRGINHAGTQLSKGKGPVLHKEKVYARLALTKNNKIHHGRPHRQF